MFFALSWAVLLPYYALQAYSRPMKPLGSLGLILEFLATYSSVPLLLTVEPLLRQARAQGEQTEGGLSWIDYITERGIYFLVAGHAILFIGEGHEAFMRLLRLLLFGLGLGFLGRVLRIWRRDALWRGFVFVAVVYFIVQLCWTVDLFLDPDSVKMSNIFMLSFAVCKIALSATFIPQVMSIRDAEQAAHAAA
jgi:hypothetical protein